MDDFETEEQEEQREQPRKRHRLRRFLLFTLILLAVLAAVVLAAYRDGTGFDALRRYFSYGSVEKSGGTEEYAYDASSDNRFAVLGDSLVVLSNAQLKIFGGSGETVYSADVAMEAPALAVGGGCAVAYDVGGTQMIVVDEKGERGRLTAAEDEPYLAASLNDKGWLAVTAEKKNYKGCVSVYSDKMELVFAFNSSERFVTDAWVTDDCKSLTAVTLGQKDSRFLSSLVFYDLDATEPRASCDVEDGLVLAMGEKDGKIAAVSDTGLTLATYAGEIAASYGYSGGYLREYDLGGDGYTALLLNRYQSGSAGTLVTVGPDGKKLASLDVKEEILSLSAAGRYLAVLYADRLVIYNQDLEEYARLSGTDYARSVLMRADGSALLLSSEKATLFLP